MNLSKFVAIVLALVGASICSAVVQAQVEQPADAPAEQEQQAAPEKGENELPPAAPRQTEEARPNAVEAKTQDVEEKKPPAILVPPVPKTEQLKPDPNMQPRPAGVARVSQQERRIQQLNDRLKQDVSKQSPAINVKMNEAVVTRRAMGPGLDLVFRADGGTLRDRVALNGLVMSSMQNDKYWGEWLKHNGAYVSYSDPPANAADITVEVPLTPEEAAQVQELLQLLQDEIELSIPLHGAYVEAATFVKPIIGPGVVLQINGRIIDEIQREPLQRALEQAAASLESWRGRRGDVFLTLDSVVVGPLDRQRSNRYFTMALEAFWHGDYPHARDAFTRALADDPTSRVLQYWRVITHVAMHEDDRARRKLLPLLAYDPWGSNGPEIAEALERLQGPLRWRLRELEQEVLMTMLP